MNSMQDEADYIGQISMGDSVRKFLTFMFFKLQFYEEATELGKAVIVSIY